MKKINLRQISLLEKLELAISNITSKKTPIRPSNIKGEPGGLISFPENDKREMIIIGDLHGNKKNLKAILQDSKNLYKLKRNEAVLIFLGDIVHDERTGHLAEMNSSVEILEIVIRLIIEYPNNIVYLRGNHDTFNPLVVKSAIKQGALFRDAIVETHGEKYAELVQLFFDLLPLFVIHKHFLAVHAGPVRGGITKDEIINIHNSEDYSWQLTWNRLNETRSNPSKKEYSSFDLEKQRELLDCAPDIPFIVGHNPMWKWGSNDSVWIDILNTKNHVILYSSLEKKCSYISFNDSPKYEVKQANLKLKKRRFVMDDY